MLRTELAKLTANGRRLRSRVNGWLTRLYDHPYNRAHPFSAPIRLFRYYALKRSGHPKDMRFWGTRTVRCYPDSAGSMWLILNVIMDWDEFHFMQDFLREGDVFLDVGANVGIYTLWASQFVGTAGRIIAFEPDPKNFLRIQEQLGLNDLKRIEVTAVALSDRTGVVRFSQGEDMLNHLVSQPESIDLIEIPATTLDAYCLERGITRVSLVKIDVEGAEQLVLGGASWMLGEHRIDVLQLEFNTQVVERGFESSRAEIMLRDLGYRLYRFHVASRSLSEVSSIDPRRHENLFAIYNEAYVRDRLGLSNAGT